MNNTLFMKNSPFYCLPAEIESKIFQMAWHSQLNDCLRHIRLLKLIHNHEFPYWGHGCLNPHLVKMCERKYHYWKNQSFGIDQIERHFDRKVKCWWRNEFKLCLHEIDEDFDWRA